MELELVLTGCEGEPLSTLGGVFRHSPSTRKNRLKDEWRYGAAIRPPLRVKVWLADYWDVRMYVGEKYLEPLHALLF